MRGRGRLGDLGQLALERLDDLGADGDLVGDESVVDRHHVPAGLVDGKQHLEDRTAVREQQRDDVVLIDAAILAPPQVFEASGHLANFSDPLVDCTKCKQRFREDHLTDPDLCPGCGAKGSFTEARAFNLMFKTYAGPVEGSGAEVYMRPETAQGMFVNFDNVQVAESLAVKAPSWGVPLLESPASPLIVAGELNRQRLLWVGFDPLQSTWPLRLSFPIFVANAVDWLNPAAARAAEDHVAVQFALVVEAGPFAAQLQRLEGRDARGAGGRWPGFHPNARAPQPTRAAHGPSSGRPPGNGPLPRPVPPADHMPFGGSSRAAHQRPCVSAMRNRRRQRRCQLHQCRRCAR